MVGASRSASSALVEKRAPGTVHWIVRGIVHGALHDALHCALNSALHGASDSTLDSALHGALHSAAHLAEREPSHPVEAILRELKAASSSLEHSWQAPLSQVRQRREETSVRSK